VPSLTDHNGPGEIPHTLSPFLCIDFVNSRFANHPGTGEVYDRLELRSWRAWFADRAGVAVRGQPSPSAYRQLIELREPLRGLLEQRVAPDPVTLRLINYHLKGSAAAWELRRKGSAYVVDVVREPSWQSVIAVVLLSYAELLSSGELDRVRECANPHCTWLFYDESRNSSRRWCDPAACGNLHSVRRHRLRTRERSRPANTG
jgi:predicted RNA-binding Zn ribbon-like protein